MRVGVFVVACAIAVAGIFGLQPGSVDAPPKPQYHVNVPVPVIPDTTPTIPPNMHAATCAKMTHFSPVLPGCAD